MPQHPLPAGKGKARTRYPLVAKPAPGMPVPRGRNGGGNGNLLNKQTATLCLTVLRRGGTRKAAAAAAGVSTVTFNNWCDHREVPRGVLLPNQLEEGGPPVDFSGMSFGDAVLRATDEAADFLNQRIMAAAVEGYKETFHYGRNGSLLRSVKEFDWKAAAWLLEHNPDMRKDWSPPKIVEMSGPDGQPIRTEGVQIVTWSPDADWLAKYAAAVNEIDGTAVDVTPRLLEEGDDEAQAS